MEINYTGEHLLPGILGNLFVILAFILAIIATASYWFASQSEEDGVKLSWRTLGRLSFRLHTLSVFGIIGTLFYMLYNQYFEYHYVWQHSNTEMPMRYILSCFWEGQEGSFLLWSFWHTILGNILIRTAKDWEGPVMTVFSSVQIFLASMLLGVFLFDYRIGSNPFTILLREHPDFVNLPIFRNPNYLDRLDGRGLNPLLQNYWMTIHPPTLFLGFASTLVPFAYAIAGLWKKQYQSWLRPALPWAFFGVMVLGTGILMGGAWAYEALSFGGFWAWDPVENASLVPWITLVGAAHLMMIHKNKGTSLVWVYILTILTFILILYSTFLTRSGVLGDTSVHAFTDLGMSGQLLIYLLFFLFLAVYLMVRHFKRLPKSPTEDKTWSREFWMFVGSLVLFIASFQIIFTTSIPVLNPLVHFFTGNDMAPPDDMIQHYNRWQSIFATVIALLMGFAQFLKYKNTDLKKFLRKLAMPAAIALAITIVLVIFADYKHPFYLALFFAATFAAVSNGSYWVGVLKGKMKGSGASIAHIGFALILLGALISTSKQEHISSSQYDLSALNSEEAQIDSRKSILLSKNDTVQMGDYFVSYRGKKQEGIYIHFQVDYMKQQEGSSEMEHDFTLFPFVQLNPRMGNVGEPDTRHFLHKDIYTHVTWARLDNVDEKPNDYSEPQGFEVSVGDTLFPASNTMMILDSLIRKVDRDKYNLEPTDLAVGASLRLYDLNMEISYLKPIFVIRDSVAFGLPDNLEKQGVIANFEHIDPNSGKISLSISTREAERDFIVMEAIVFPYINILWLGCVLLIIGTVIAIRHRIGKSLKN